MIEVNGIPEERRADIFSKKAHPWVRLFVSGRREFCTKLFAVQLRHIGNK